MPDRHQELTKLLYSCPDLPGEFYSLQKQHLFSAAGLKINISPWLFYAYQPQKFFGGSPNLTNHYWLIHQSPGPNQFSLYFPQGWSNTFADVWSYCYDATKIAQLQWQTSDTSHRLNNYLNFRHLNLFPDEVVEVSFEQNGAPLPGQWIESQWLQQKEYRLFSDTLNLESLLAQPIYLVMKIRHPQALRQQVEQHANFHDALVDGWKVIHHFNQLMPSRELTKILQEFKLPTDVGKIIPENLDLFDLKGIILRFHVILRYPILVRAYRLNLKAKIQQLQIGNSLELTPVKKNHWPILGTSI